jgi:hypothetical protein
MVKTNGPNSLTGIDKRDGSDDDSSVAAAKSD